MVLYPALRHRRCRRNRAVPVHLRLRFIYDGEDRKAREKKERGEERRRTKEKGTERRSKRRNERGQRKKEGTKDGTDEETSEGEDRRRKKNTAQTVTLSEDSLLPALVFPRKSGLAGVNLASPGRSAQSVRETISCSALHLPTHHLLADQSIQGGMSYPVLRALYTPYVAIISRIFLGTDAAVRSRALSPPPISQYRFRSLASPPQLAPGSSSPCSPLGCQPLRPVGSSWWDRGRFWVTGHHSASHPPLSRNMLVTVLCQRNSAVPVLKSIGRLSAARPARGVKLNTIHPLSFRPTCL